MLSVSLFLAVVGAFVAGFVDAIAGGGGVITVPTFLLLGFSPQMALGTNKLVSASGTTAAAISFIWRKKFSPELVWKALPCSAIGAVIGAILAGSISTEVFKPLIAVVIVILAMYFFFRPSLGRNSSYSGPSFRIYLIVLFGALGIGLYDGVLGPGTGAFLTFLFVRLIGQDFVLAAGNTKILNWVSNIVALVVFVNQGFVDYATGIPMAIANIAGAFIGASFAMRKGAGLIRWIFIVMALLISGKMLIEFIRS